MWLLHWLGREHDIAEVAVRTIERWRVVRPELPECADIFVSDGPALLKRWGAKGFILFAHPPDAAPDNDPPLGEHVDRGQRLGGEDGRTVRNHHDGCEQFRR